jgi:LysR family glycine cleavage system transcriptional activator
MPSTSATLAASMKSPRRAVFAIVVVVFPVLHEDADDVPWPCCLSSHCGDRGVHSAAQADHHALLIELMLQVTIPGHHLTAEEADIELRLGQGAFADRESTHLLSEDICPVCSPEYLHETGPLEGFDSDEIVARAHLIPSPLEPWHTWFRACGIGLPEPRTGTQFNDLGLVLDAAVAGFGVALMRLKLGQAWLDSGRLVRLSRESVRSPNDYFLCWKPGTLERWECAAFVDWLRQALRD